MAQDKDKIIEKLKKELDKYKFGFEASMEADNELLKENAALIAFHDDVVTSLLQLHGKVSGLGYDLRLRKTKKKKKKSR